MLIMVPGSAQLPEVFQNLSQVAMRGGYFQPLGAGKRFTHGQYPLQELFRLRHVPQLVRDLAQAIEG